MACTPLSGCAHSQELYEMATTTVCCLGGVLNVEPTCHCHDVRQDDIIEKIQFDAHSGSNNSGLFTTNLSRTLDSCLCNCYCSLSAVGEESTRGDDNVVHEESQDKRGVNVSNALEADSTSAKPNASSTQALGGDYNTFGDLRKIKNGACLLSLIKAVAENPIEEVMIDAPILMVADVPKKPIGNDHGDLVNAKASVLVNQDDIQGGSVVESQCKFAAQMCRGPTAPRKMLVLDLDETLVHSTFEVSAVVSSKKNRFMVSLVQDGEPKNIYVSKRPFVDEFLLTAAQYFELVVFTAGLEAYASPLLDQLDVHKVISRRLFRQDCIYWNGIYIKDLVIFNKPLTDVVIIDNTPSAYCLQPHNAIAIKSWYEDPNDVELLKLLPLLSQLAVAADVVDLLHQKHCKASDAINDGRTTTSHSTGKNAGISMPLLQDSVEGQALDSTITVAVE